MCKCKIRNVRIVGNFEGTWKFGGGEKKGSENDKETDRQRHGQTKRESEKQRVR